jgi:hypothetical protein
MELADRQLANVNVSLRAFLVIATWLARWRAHFEVARWHHDQLGTLGAVAKRLSRADDRDSPFGHRGFPIRSGSATHGEDEHRN